MDTMSPPSAIYIETINQVSIDQSEAKPMPTFEELQNNLLHCPFCGFSATLSEYQETEVSGGWIKPGWTVACLDESCYANGSLLTWPNPLEAAKAWNKRSDRVNATAREIPI